jgi:phenylalanine ammonia-lyase
MRLLALIQDRSGFNALQHLRFLTFCSQIEAACTIWNLLDGSKLAVGDEEDVTIDQDQGELRQDRYPLRTAPQFLGPQIEDILAALNSISIECNSSTFGRSHFQRCPLMTFFHTLSN